MTLTRSTPAIGDLDGDLAVMSHGIPTRVRETTLKIRHPGGF